MTLGRGVIMSKPLGQYHQAINLFSLLYQFPMVPVISYHKFSSLKQRLFFSYSSEGQMSKIQVSAKLQRPQENPFQLLPTSGDCWQLLVFFGFTEN